MFLRRKRDAASFAIDPFPSALGVAAECDGDRIEAYWLTRPRFRSIEDAIWTLGLSDGPQLPTLRGLFLDAGNQLLYVHKKRLGGPVSPVDLRELLAMANSCQARAMAVVVAGGGVPPPSPAEFRLFRARCQLVGIILLDVVQLEDGVITSLLPTAAA